MHRTSVLLADDNSAVLNHVAHMLEKDFDVVAAVQDGPSALRQCTSLKPQIVVLDISMGASSGIDVARQLHDSGSAAKIIFLTVHEDPDFVNAALGAGASAYVVKSRLGSDLLLAIRAALAGKLFVSPTLLYETS